VSNRRKLSLNEYSDRVSTVGLYYKRFAGPERARQTGTRFQFKE
jgi:hypothetical protein